MSAHTPLVQPLPAPASAARDSIAQARGLAVDSLCNMAEIAVDRHVAAGRGERIAFRFINEDGERQELSYRALAQASMRFANALKALGIGRGDCVFLLCERRCELYIAVIGTLRLGAIVSPLFPAFGPEPIRNRMTQAAGKLLLTTSSAYRRKLAPIRAQLPTLQHVVVIDDLGAGVPPATLAWDALLAAAPETPILADTGANDPALLHFTSGTTGTPKGALHVHQAILGQRLAAAGKD